MFIPLHDGVPMRRLRAPYVTYALIALNVAIFALTGDHILSEDGTAVVAAGLGAIPSVIFGLEALPDGYPFVPAPLTLATSLFLHVSWFHLAGNMLFLWVFGDNVEDGLGHLRFLLFYILCGLAGALVHALANPDSLRPLVGASGSVSGVIAAYLVLHPRVKVWGLVFARIPFRLRAAWGIGLWMALQIGQAVMGGDENIGWFAHLGGFAAGMALVFLLRQRDQVLFGQADGADLTGDA